MPLAVALQDVGSQVGGLGIADTLQCTAYGVARRIVLYDADAGAGRDGLRGFVLVGIEREVILLTLSPIVAIHHHQIRMQCLQCGAGFFLKHEGVGIAPAQFVSR